ncbi:MAG TPA: hypothetical protein VMW24_26770 [Sedimentisphaerales bacterium]|nr:hypothetical protein [Sedimentisphaerales bacterium]
MSERHNKRYHSALFNLILKVAVLMFGVAVPAGIAVEKEAQAGNFRRPGSDNELKYWLENMVWYHRFTNDEITASTGLANSEISAAMKKLGIRRDNRPEPNNGSALFVLPYPGGRHPRIGFLEGAIDPQRETKFSVFAP